MPLSGKDYNEKRNFIRMFVNSNVHISDPKTGTEYQGKGKNLSGDGALFTTSENFAIGQKLNLKISPEQSNLASLSAEFKVVRVKELTNNTFEIAGTMLDVK